MPAAVFLWLIGWSLYWIGSKRRIPSLKVNPAKKEQEDFSPLLIMLEQQYAN
jgi:hypothetical protein